MTGLAHADGRGSSKADSGSDSYFDATVKAREEYHQLLKANPSATAEQKKEFRNQAMAPAEKLFDEQSKKSAKNFLRSAVRATASVNLDVQAKKSQPAAVAKNERAAGGASSSSTGSRNKDMTTATVRGSASRGGDGGGSRLPATTESGKEAGAESISFGSAPAAASEPASGPVVIGTGAAESAGAAAVSFGSGGQ